MKIILSINNETKAIETIEVTDEHIPEETGSMHTLFCDSDEEKRRVHSMSVENLVNEYTEWHTDNKNS